MRIAILADTHLPRGPRRLPEGCIEACREADLLIHAGDFVSLAALEAIETIGPPLRAVHGNVDAPAIVDRLPAELTFAVGGATIGLIHDAGPRRGRLARMRRRFPDSDAVIFGHSHMPLAESGQGLTIFNPGSPTERRRSPVHTMGIAQVEAGRLSFAHIELVPTAPRPAPPPSGSRSGAAGTPGARRIRRRS